LKAVEIDASLEDTAKRQALVDRVLADPPVVHYMSRSEISTGRLTGVWSTQESCYRFLADRCREGSRTLETGSGISTILFAAWGAQHRCITPGKEEVDAVIAYCRAHGISSAGLTFDVACSEAALIRLDPSDPPLDIVLIDGCHGFPTPMIDWYFAAGRLCRGGVVIVDDLQLPAVKLLCNFLDRDTRWHRIQGTEKWAAYERRSEGPLVEDWDLQPFYSLPNPGLRVVGRFEARVRRALGPAKRSLKLWSGRTSRPAQGGRSRSRSGSRIP